MDKDLLELEGSNQVAASYLWVEKENLLVAQNMYNSLFAYNFKN